MVILVLTKSLPPPLPGIYGGKKGVISYALNSGVKVGNLWKCLDDW